MLDSDSTCSTSDYNEIYSLFTKTDLEDLLTNQVKQSRTVKEECETIERLRSENFKLRLDNYLINKEYKELLESIADSKQSSETGSIKNLKNHNKESIKDKEIKILRLVLEQRVKDLSSLKNYYDELLKSKDLELDELRMIKSSDAYVNELECNTTKLYEIIEQKNYENQQLNNELNEQKNINNKLKDNLLIKEKSFNELIKKQNDQLNELNKLNELNELNDKQINKNQQLNDNQITNTLKISLDETRKELDKIKFELKNQKIIEKEKLDNYSQLVRKKEVENELLKEQILELKENLKEREIYLEKENEQLKINEQKLLNQLDKLKDKIELLIKQNNDYELKFKEEYLIKKKQEFQLNDQHDENDNLIKNNSFNLNELMDYIKNLEDKLDDQNEIIKQNKIEKQKLIMNLNHLKERKNNYEKIITQQLEKTNYLLKTAKMNLINKQT